MEERFNPKRAGSWSSDTTYHPLTEDDDTRKTFINSDNADDVGDSREQPKIALTKRFSWLHPIVHLLPVGVTVGILQLSFREIYWDDDTRYDTRWQAVLQFPAKLHEILVVGSLSAMVLHIFRRMLVGSHGIPLGLMVGAFQIGSAEYLISKSYVKPFRHSLAHRQIKTFSVALALGLAILYSFLVGPASAGALIPVLTWWDMRTPFNDSLPLTSYIGRSAAHLYPMSLQESNVGVDCLGGDWYYQGCPAQGFNTLDDWAWTRVQERARYNVTEGHHYNPTMPSIFSGRAQREIVTALVTSRNSSTAAALAATLHSSVLTLTDAFWHYISSNIVGKVNDAKRPKLTISKDTPVSIPFVQVQCATYNFEEISHGYFTRDPYITFETGAMVYNFSRRSSNEYSWRKWIVPDEAWNFTRPLNETSVVWVDTADIKGTQDELSGASLAAVVTVPARYRNSWDDQSSFTSPCIIDARWATTDVTFDTADDLVRTSLTDWLDSGNLLTGDVDMKAALSKWRISDPISLSRDWAATLNSLDLKTSEDSIYYGLGFVEYLIQRFVQIGTGEDGQRLLNFFPSSGESTPRDISNDVAIILGTVVADWLSRSTLRDTRFTTVLSGEDEGNVTAVNLLAQRTVDAFGPTPLAAFDGQTAVAFRVQRYGWGYGLSTDTIWFSVVILLAHAALVALYFGYSFVFWCRAKGWTSNAWGSIGELVALAALSPPADELRNSGAGINRSKTWMTRLRLREVGSDPARLELLVGTRGGAVIPTTNRVQIDKEYS
ncbi:putative short-chain dehydrogenase [Rosellinia necatrix]|uniref:Putative short-chain dehydrogenase n=1 Tax=Rosellinia necatrix TaxID=77044 RepID=A0A1W2TN24_ROSNE|nr:putative short-chain dehydrogenase [Rosellinia necatrix]